MHCTIKDVTSGNLDRRYCYVSEFAADHFTITIDILHATLSYSLSITSL